jgi:Ca2+/Na+ antiporter
MAHIDVGFVLVQSMIERWRRLLTTGQIPSPQENPNIRDLVDQEEIMGAVFGVLTLIAGIWTIVLSQRVDNSAIEFLPPQFQDPLSSRYALPGLALSHPMPLSLQAEYIKSQKVSCVAVLCGALTLFSFHQIVFGCLALAAFFVCVFRTIKSSKIYQQNCSRVLAQGDKYDQ